MEFRGPAGGEAGIIATLCVDAEGGCSGDVGQAGVITTLPSPQPTLPSPFPFDCRPPPQVIKRYIMHSKKTAFIVEHDFIMATYLADRVIVFEGEPSKNATATLPQSLSSGERRGSLLGWYPLAPLVIKRPTNADLLSALLTLIPHSAQV